MKNIFAVCDIEKDYAIHLMEYLNRGKHTLPFEVHVFTSVEELQEFAKGQHIEILLIAENSFKEDIREIDCSKIMILSEDGELEDIQTFPTIYKYQQADQMIREVMDFYSAEKEVVKPRGIYRKNTRRIAVFNSGEETLRTTAAICLGCILAESSEVLYLNLSAGLGLEQILHASGQRNLSDLLYFYRRNRDGLIYRIGGVLQTIHGLDYILPVTDAEDLLMMSDEDWIQFLDEIQNTSRYECIILDFDRNFPAAPSILESCSEIYIPAADNLFSESAAESLCTELMPELTSGKLIREIRTDIAKGNDELLSFVEYQLQSRMGSDIRRALQNFNHTEAEVRMRQESSERMA